MLQLIYSKTENVNSETTRIPFINKKVADHTYMQRTSRMTGSKRASGAKEFNNRSTTSRKYCRYRIHWYRLTSILIEAK